LIHSPLVGKKCWVPVEGLLRRGGADARAIDYEDLRGPDWYGGAAAAIARRIEDIEGSWVLVVHSAAGGLAPSILAAAPASPAAIVFVDSILPHPGRSWLETAPPCLSARVRSLAEDGMLPPWNRWFADDPAANLIQDPETLAEFTADLPRLPLAFLECAAPLLAAETAIPTGYLQLSASYAGEAREARRRSWRVEEAPAHHLAMVTHPDKVGPKIVELAAALLGR